MSGQEAQYEPIAETTDAEDEAADYKLAEDPGPMDYALHPLKYEFSTLLTCLDIVGLSRLLGRSTESFFVKLTRHYG